ncbi:MAG TPA: tetratricopeptide repeat protein [Longilinea sp.]|nr:tetratricopeptide repeat protein [Longilinea sp.]
MRKAALLLVICLSLCAGCISGYEAGAENSQTIPESQRLRDESDIPGAWDTVQREVEDDPNDPLLAYQAALLAVTVEPEHAQPWIDNAIGSNPDYLTAMQPVLEAMQALEADPAYFRVRMAQALGSLYSWDLAAYLLQESIAISPEYVDAWALLGEAHQQMGLAGGDELERAESLDPRADLVRALMGLYWRRQGQPDQALVYYDALAQAHPQEAEWQMEAGASLAEMGDLVSALVRYQNGVTLEPQSSEAWLGLAAFSLQYSVDLSQIGLPAARQAVRYSPASAEAVTTLGLILATQGDEDTARRFFLRSIVIDPLYFSPVIYLAQLELSAGNVSRSRLYLEYVIDHAVPGDPILEQAGQLLEQVEGSSAN